MNDDRLIIMTDEIPQRPPENEGIKWPAFIQFFIDILKPGISFSLIKFMKVLIFSMTVFFGTMIYVDYNIHYVIMCILSICFFFSFQYFSYQLQKYPELMDPSLAKDKED